MSAATMSASMPAHEMYSAAWELFVSTRLEILMFLSAIVAYAILNMHRTSYPYPKKNKVDAKLIDESDKPHESYNNVGHRNREASPLDRKHQPLHDNIEGTSHKVSTNTCGNFPKPSMVDARTGSLIKAYGDARDVDAAWRCWKEMRNSHIKPSSITLGCMVDALVSNGDTEGAYDLLQHIQDDDQCRSALNSVVYCSVLKGFAREKRVDRLWTVYREMNKKGLEMSIVVYNTLIDACARAGRMESVPNLMEDMKQHGIQPNLITFSTRIKGHCQAGDIHTAFSLVEQMKNETSFKPDEIMYNSLLDGCAQHGLVDEGLRLLDEMQDEGIKPTNFTLSVLVKLMNRARKVDQAFRLADEISKKYNFKLNVHVYTNLIQACISGRQLSRAMDTLDVMVTKQVLPESRTYSLLIRASMASNLFEQALTLLRSALDLPCADHVVARAACPNLDHNLVNETLKGLADKGAHSLAVLLLHDIKSHMPRVRIDACIQRKLTPWRAKAAEA